MVLEGPAGNEPTENELERLTTRELSQGFRLACQLRVEGAIEISIPPEGLASRVAFQTAGIETKLPRLQPAIKKYYVEVAEPSFQSLEPDAERLVQSLRRYNFRRLHFSVQTVLNVPDTLRKAGWKVTVVIQNDRDILAVEEGDTRYACYGLAIDVGTTKIACHLVDLLTGESVAASGKINPQVSYGSDILSRITYASNSAEHRHELKAKVLHEINELIAELCTKSAVDPNHIYAATIVGNTAMHHLLLGICPAYLSESPYVPAIKAPMEIRADDLGLGIQPQANVHFLPLIAAFVGADCVAAILATRLFSQRNYCLLLDIGTNTEVVLGNRDRIVSCSCASGPAFEGGHVKQGMQASEGAIEHVTIDPETLHVCFQTVGNGAPRGLCGSGIIDTVAQMLRTGLIDVKGMMKHDEQTGRVRINEDGEAEFVLSEEPAEIVISQKDVAAIQLAKAAVFTAITILMREMQISVKQIVRVYIAGAFGASIDPANAITIGLIPPVPLASVRNVGNAAGTGARIALVSTKQMQLCKTISNRVEYVELAAHPDFHPTFFEALRFPVLS